MLWVPCPQESAQSLQQILIRLTSFALAFLLLAISIGWPLSRQLADVCWIAGLNGIAFYFALELVADQRARQEQQALLATNTGIDLGEQRLSYRLYEEQRLAKIREAELPKKHGARQSTSLNDLHLSLAGAAESSALVLHDRSVEREKHGVSRE